jgi:hypothetical protein
MKMYFQYCELYNKSSKQFYEEYFSLKEEIDNLNGAKAFWDYTSHTSEENYRYDINSFIARRNAFAAIVFQALAIESYLNLYGSYHLSEKFDKEYEYKPTLKKLKSLCKDVVKKEFPADDNLYKDIDLLFRKRDSLVHDKVHLVETTLPENELRDPFLDYENYIFNDIKKDIGIYDRLKAKLKELEGAEADIIEKLSYEIGTEALRVLMDTFLL